MEAAGSTGDVEVEVEVGVKAGAAVGEGKLKSFTVGVGKVELLDMPLSEAIFSSVAFRSATRSAIRASRSLSSSSCRDA